VGMRYKNMTDFEKVFGRKRINISQIKNCRAFLKNKGYEKARILKRTVD